MNTEFIKIQSPSEVKMRVWERGAGETWACGTGASAVGVAGVLTGRTERVTVHVKAEIFSSSGAKTTVSMTGGAEEVFQGTVRIQ